MSEPKTTAIRCPVCGGNDANVPCAYPGDNPPGCLRAWRLAHPRPDDPVERMMDAVVGAATNIEEDNA